MQEPQNFKITKEKSKTISKCIKLTKDTSKRK